MNTEDIRRLGEHQEMKKALAEWAKAYKKTALGTRYPKPRDVKLYELCEKLGLTA